MLAIQLDGRAAGNSGRGGGSLFLQRGRATGSRRSRAGAEEIVLVVVLFER